MDSVGSSDVPAERACAHHSQPASVLHTHQSLRTLKRSHVERKCNLPTMGPDLFAFTSLSKLLVCEVVGVIKFGGGKEQPFKGSLIAKRAVCEALFFYLFIFSLSNRISDAPNGEVDHILNNFFLCCF